MSITRCPTCRSEISWDWTEAFDKFGFDDGDGLVLTEHVAAALRKAGYVVQIEAWGIHNITISSIRRKGSRKELIPERVAVGYEDARSCLPKRIVDALDAAFPEAAEVEL